MVTWLSLTGSEPRPHPAHGMLPSAPKQLKMVAWPSFAGSEPRSHPAHGMLKPVRLQLAIVTFMFSGGSDLRTHLARGMRRSVMPQIARLRTWLTLMASIKHSQKRRAPMDEESTNLEKFFCQLPFDLIKRIAFLL
ncbi:hypothetical protein ABBQ38_014611 [Trebouxia sp. C0009 RCD-2024]